MKLNIKEHCKRPWDPTAILKQEPKRDPNKRDPKKSPNHIDNLKNRREQR